MTLRRRGPGHPYAGPPRARLFCLLAALAMTSACSPPGRPQGSDRDRIQAQRDGKDQYFRDGSDSPIPPGKQNEFLPLAYFPIDESYAAPAVLAPSEREPAIEMPTSTGQRRQMRRAGTLKFSVRGQPLQLTAFVEAGDQAFTRLFVPFGDLTNGTETYPAGRYIDLTRTATGLYEIDFNLAYHPYCYYNPTYDCPYPPRENRLQIPVRAGERMK
jgi:uncharacterized protein (DUF1684 family)